jgi:hypothetical protein
VPYVHETATIATFGAPLPTVILAGALKIPLIILYNNGIWNNWGNDNHHQIHNPNIVIDSDNDGIPDVFEDASHQHSNNDNTPPNTDNNDNSGWFNWGNNNNDNGTWSTDNNDNGGWLGK